MKFFIGFVFFVLMAFPVFSQNAGNANTERFNNLSEAINTSLAVANERLAEFNDSVSSAETLGDFTEYRVRYENLIHAMRASERRLQGMIRGNARNSRVNSERDHFAALVRQLDSIRADYDAWVRSAR